MTPEQAVQILRELLPNLAVPLQTHMAAQQAVRTLAIAAGVEEDDQPAAGKPKVKAA